MDHQATLEDKRFIESLEAFEIAADDFDHRSHLRMAYIYLCDHDADSTCLKIRRVLCSFLSHLGVDPTSKYHETMTRAWVLAVQHFMTITPKLSSASDFIDANPCLLDTGILERHYSKHVLFSEAARNSFVEPDLAPIPGCDDVLYETN